MKNRETLILLVVVLLSLGFVAGCATRGLQKPLADAPADAVAEIRWMTEAWLTCIETGDPDWACDLYQPCPDVAGLYRTDFPIDITPYPTDPDNIHVEISEDGMTGWSWFMAEMWCDEDGTSTRDPVFMTAVFTRTDQGWRMLRVDRADADSQYK